MSVVVLLGLILVAATGPEKEALARPDDVSTKPGLKLVIEPLGERYCGDYPQSGTLQIQSRLHFRNTSNQPLILYKGAGEILTMRAAKTKNDLKARQFEFEWSFFNISDRPLWAPAISELSRPTPKEFVILSPGASFETDTMIPIGYVRTEMNVAGCLPPGEHFIQVEAGTWPEPADLGKVLQARWKKWGNLWYAPSVLSEPLRVTIAQEPEVESCD